MAASRVANKYPTGFGSVLLAVINGLNLNALGDTVLNLIDTPTKFRIRAVAATNASINPTTARYSINTGAAVTGTQLVATVTPSMASTAVVTDLTINSTNAITGTGALYINVSVAQGAVSTIDLYIYGDIYTG